MNSLFLSNLRTEFFVRLAVGSVLSVTSMTAGAEYNAAEFFPIEPDSYWVYNDGDGGWTTAVEPSWVDVNGVATRQLTDSDGWTSWMTNDESGLRMHRSFSPDEDIPGHTENLAVTRTYFPPVKVLEPVFHSGQHYALSGEATIEIEGLGTFPGSYAWDITIGGMEEITVPAGTYEAVAISTDEAIRVVIDGDTIVDDDICTLWLVRGIGIVKQACRGDPDSVLTETNLSPIIDAGQLAVQPNAGYQVLVATGGGTASPASRTYSVRNPGRQALEFSVSSDADWLDIAPARGQLDPGAEVVVIVSVNGNVQALAPNRLHETPVRFDNLTDGAGSTVRTASALLLASTATDWGISTSEGFDDTTSLAVEGLPANTTAELKILIDAPATQQAGIAAASIPILNLAFQVRTAIEPQDSLTVSVAGEPARQWSEASDWAPACISLSSCPRYPCEISFALSSREGGSGRDVYIDSVTTAPDVHPIAALLPSSRSAQVGHSVTAFATLINGGTEAGRDCALRPITPVSGGFTYQTTDPATNRLIGTADVPHDVAGGHSQSFVFAFSPDAALDPTDVELRFDCSNSCGPAPVVRGLNTFLLSASEQPTPDVVALAATIDGDGIVKIPGETGTGVFSVASVNVGNGGAIRVSADTGGIELPVRLLLCQTDPLSGICLQAPASDVATEIAAGATPTFGIFAQGSGQVDFDPAAHRVFVRFRDQAGVVRGATSVAVHSQ